MNGLPFVFANPWGALALLGIPIVVAIHCLQQKSRILKISTLFLVERMAPDSREGRRFTWLRSSLPFWLQILCVLIVTWLLLDPRWMQANAVQRVVLVMDSSLSMRAFTDDIVGRTSSRLQALAALAPRTYWTVLETDPSRPTLYEGLDLAALDEKLKTWTPSLPAHDPSHALELARSLVTKDALVVFITDRPHEVPSGVDLLAIGEPIENCGLVGSRLVGSGNDLEWQAVVQNYGKKPVHRTWWLELGGQKTEPQALDLDPGQPRILKGKFPSGLDRIEVCLESDRFPVDDRLPMVRPQPKQLTVNWLGKDSTTELFERLTRTLPSLTPATPGQVADLAIVAVARLQDIPSQPHAAIVLLDDATSKAPLEGGPFVVEDDPLNRDLNWQGLVLPMGTRGPPQPGDHVLLWKDHFPVIYTRNARTLSGECRQLVFNFDFATSNAARLPAFVLLLNRFIESIRLEKEAPETRNAELVEPLTIAAKAQGNPVVLHQPGGATTSFPARAIVTLQAPGSPGFFSITQGDETLLTGAAQYADARESDFSAAASLDTLAARRSHLVELHARAESITPLWILLIGVALVINWYASRPRAS